MTERQRSPAKGAPSIYPNLQRHDITSEEEEDTTLDLQAQLVALRNAQVSYQIENRELKSSLAQMQATLDRIALQEENRGRTTETPDRQLDPDQPVRSTESVRQSTPASQGSQKNNKSTRLPDPPILTDGVDPSYEHWIVNIQGKLIINADHYESEDARMYYVFGRTGGDAQKHLYSRFSYDAVERFETVKEMFECLKMIFTNPNKVRDARYEYNQLTMSVAQTFPAFQTQFLHLAGEAQIPKESYRYDLYDKLTTSFQRQLAPTLHTLTTYEALASTCVGLDSELRKIKA